MVFPGNVLSESAQSTALMKSDQYKLLNHRIPGDHSNSIFYYIWLTKNGWAVYIFQSRFINFFKPGFNRYFYGPLWIKIFFFQLVFFFPFWQLYSPKEQMRIGFHRWEIIFPSSNISPLDITSNWINMGDSPIELIPTLAGQLKFTCYTSEAKWYCCHWRL